MNRNLRPRKATAKRPPSGNGIESSELKKDRTNRENPISAEWALACMVFLLGAFFFVGSTFHYFPNLPEAETDLPRTQFSEKRARVYLDDICNIGPRHTGSVENEKLAVEYLLGVVKRIAADAKPVHTVSVDLQSNLTGCFNINFLGKFTSCYQNVKNVLVKFGPEIGSKTSLLVNCHFDSAISSPGASDDVSSCAMMLEALSVLSQSERPFPHNIVFIFNGAEETVLQASHGFITQHPWGKEAKAFVNLEAAGSGGHEVVFQTGPEHPWLIEAYARSSKYPSANVIGQEIFQSGVIKSDTDFRIFRDYGDIPGIDVAYVYNGYIYHTKYDTPEYIPAGCLQRGGENLVALLKRLAVSPQLANPEMHKHGTAVFYDLNGLFMVIYSQSVAKLLHYGVVFGVLLQLSRKLLSRQGGNRPVYFHLFALGVFSNLVVSVLVAGAAVAIGFVVTYIQPLSFYSNTWVLVPLYVCPVTAVWVILHKLVQRAFHPQNLSATFVEQTSFDSALFVLTLILWALTYCGSGSAYIVTLYVLPPLILKQHTLPGLRYSLEGTPKKYALLTMLPVVLPLLHIFYLTYILMVFVIPLTGRAGTAIPPDMVAAGLVAFIVLLATFCLSGLLYATRNIKRVVGVLLTFFVIGLILIKFTSVGFPFSDNKESPSVQRLVLKHIRLLRYDQAGEMTSRKDGLILMPFDYVGVKALEEYAPELKGLEPLPCDTTAAYCGFAYYLPIIELLQKVFYIPTEPAKFSRNVEISLKKREILPHGSVNISVEVTGGQHVHILMTPRKEVELQAWSFLDAIVETDMIGEASERKHYFVFQTSADEPCPPTTFWIQLKVNEGVDPEKAIVDMLIGNHQLDGPDSSTPQLRAFAKKLPDWSAPLIWTFDGQQREF